LVDSHRKWYSKPVFWNGTWGDECYNEAFSPGGKGVIAKLLLYLALVFFPS
jgi:hypothetical protein